MEKIRTCLGCRRPFYSLSSANRFCKTCRKKHRHLSGGLEALDYALLSGPTSSALLNYRGECTSVSAPRPGPMTVYRVPDPAPKPAPAARRPAAEDLPVLSFNIQVPIIL